MSGYHGGTMKMSVALRCESIMTESSSLEIIKEICECRGQNIAYTALTSAPRVL